MHKNNIGLWQHSHSFGQEQKRSGEKRTLIVVALTLVMMIWEIAAGWSYGSMALLADGLHMGSHATALGIAVFAYAYARKNANSTHFSFGTGKVNALGGFTGAVLLAGFALFMAAESVERFIHPVTISFNAAIFVAIVGLAVNGLSAWILGHDHDHGHSHSPPSSHDHDHNRRAAYFHVLADALTSLLAIFALLAGKYAGWNWMDPAMGILGAVLVTRWAWGLLRDTSAVLLDRQNAILERAIRDTIEIDDEIASDLHVWSIGPGLYAVIVAVVTHHPQPSSHYREKISTAHSSVAHVTVEVQACSSQHDRAHAS
ncbi:CDF family Co(II)/Ni(II) efflux transporter DmeF [Salinisphaera aquimarina]|uniref:CDF family Co(II)/Ni(II) efflux transporter DmeF n=1 Tax=Salinisphaera aquimarina TaxID=2094031 RepID=A0ABV7EWN8_9GAMM